MASHRILSERALLIVLDSLGIGGAPDAADFGDAEANTLGNILAQKPGLKTPAMDRLGLRLALERSEKRAEAGCHGWMREVSAGKDTTTGHWELAGAPLKKPFRVYKKFPPKLVGRIEAEAGVEFIGNKSASGTVILEELGEEHLRTGKPILYTSADSVLQIAAHESILPPNQLYVLCRVARKACDHYNIGRVIARPFAGDPGEFRRTAGRHDFSKVPPPTILNALCDAGVETRGVGKISDIFAGSGLTSSHPTADNQEGMQTIDALWSECCPGLIFANLVDFDMLYGHRRDVDGYAKALEEFDHWLASFLPRLRSDDLLILTGDHGNDPTQPGTDHTREMVPLLVVRGSARQCLGERETFADVAATLSAFFQLPEPWSAGNSFLPANLG